MRCGDVKRSVRDHVHPDPASRRSIHAARLKTSLLTALETEIRFLRPDVALIHVHWELTGQAGPDGAVLPTRQGILSHVVVKTGGKWRITSTQNTDIAAIPSAPTSH
jgi:hypothetical protein